MFSHDLVSLFVLLSDIVKLTHSVVVCFRFLSFYIFSLGLTVTDWLEDIGASINARKMSTEEMFDFVMEHLVGETKSKMRLRFR